MTESLYMFSTNIAYHPKVIFKVFKRKDGLFMTRKSIKLD